MFTSIPMINCPVCGGKTRVSSVNNKNPEATRRYRRCQTCAYTFVTTQPQDKSIPEAITERMDCLSRKGENNFNAKLTDADVIEMRQYAAEGNSSLECALAWDVSQKVAWNAIVGRTWKHVPMPVQNVPTQALHQ